MAAAAPKEWQRYTNPVLGVSIEYPKEWGFEESPAVGIVVFMDSEVLKAQSATPLTPVVNLITQKIPGTNLEEFSTQQLSRMQEMTGGGNIKVDKTAKFGEHPAHKAISTLDLPGASMKFFSLWSYVDGMGYSFFFHSPGQAFNDHSAIITHMLKSFQTIKIIPQSFPLDTFSDNGIIFRYPSNWKAVRKTDLTSKGPIVTITDEENFKGVNYTTTLKTYVAAKQGPLTQHIEMLKVQLEKMGVENVEIVSTKVGTKDARLAIYQSDAQQQDMRYWQLLTTESEAMDSPVVTLLMTTNVKKSESDQSTDLFRMIRNSFVFLSDSESVRKTASYQAYYHLKFNFGFLYDPEHYVYRQEGIPLTEASFIRAGDDPVNPLVNFSVIVRALDPAETPNLDTMADDLQENLKGVCGNTLDRVSAEECTLSGHPARVIIFRGSAVSPINPADVEDMYFVYKYVINRDANTALLFAFAATPQYWQAEWKLVESYLDTLYWTTA